VIPYILHAISNAFLYTIKSLKLFITAMFPNINLMIYFEFKGFTVPDNDSAVGHNFHGVLLSIFSPVFWHGSRVTHNSSLTTHNCLRSWLHSLPLSLIGNRPQLPALRAYLSIHQNVCIYS
jgi:hypothetical protein